MRRWIKYGTFVAGLAGLVGPQVLRGQSAPAVGSRNLLAVGAGGFFDDINGDDPSALGTVRLGRELNRYFVAELITGYSRTGTKSVDLGTFAVQHASTPFAHADVGLEAQIPWVVAPYVGIAAGVFNRSGAPGVSPDHGTGVSAAAGARVWATSRVFVQGEFRAREDHYTQFTAHNVEMTLGLGGRF